MHVKSRIDGARATLELDTELLRAAELAEASELAALPAPGVLVLAGASLRRAWLAGSLASMAVGEVLGFANTTLKTGLCTFRLGGGLRKTLWLRDGQVVFASSTDPDDRLGPTLLRAGLVTLVQLDEADRLVSPQHKLGRVLVERAAIKPTDVYEGVRHQVRHIVLGLFDASEGQFVLAEGPCEPPTEVKLTERTRDLLLEGMKRPELLARIVGVVPDPAAALERVPDAAPPRPGPMAVALGCVDGARSVQEVVTASRLGRVDGLLAVSALVEYGFARPVPSAPVSPAVLRGPVVPAAGPSSVLPAELPGPALHAERPGLVASAELPAPAAPAELPGAAVTAALHDAAGAASAPALAALQEEETSFATLDAPPAASTAPQALLVYGRCLQRIFVTLRDETGFGHSNLEVYLLDPPAPVAALLDGVGLTEEGALDVARLWANATRLLPEAQVRGRCLEVLEQFLSYALFEAKNLLPPAESQKLVRDVTRIQLGRG